MAIHVTNVAYLAFRLMPFILVASFVLQSIINWDMKGIVYLAGLMMACGSNVFLNSMAGPSEQPLEPNPTCGLISLGENQTMFSQFPISITVYSYTFWFLFMFILNLARAKKDSNLSQIKSADLATALQENIPILIGFPLLIVAEGMWIQANQCSPSWLYSFGAMSVGGLWGFLWGLTIMMTNSERLQYISRAGVDVCSRPTKTLYRCKTIS